MAGGRHQVPSGHGALLLEVPAGRPGARGLDIGDLALVRKGGPRLLLNVCSNDDGGPEAGGSGC